MELHAWLAKALPININHTRIRFVNPIPTPVETMADRAALSSS